MELSDFPIKQCILIRLCFLGMLTLHISMRLTLIYDTVIYIINNEIGGIVKAI